MKFFDSKGREVCDVEFDGGGKETYISSAVYLDDGSEVPEEELEGMAEGQCLCGQCRSSSWS
jgi:hypothetical protein